MSRNTSHRSAAAAFLLTAFALGGLFHPHYYLGLLPSLCVLAGLGVDRLDQSRRPVVQSLAVGAVTLGLLTMTASSMEILRLPSADARIAKAARDGRLRGPAWDPHRR